MEYMNFLVAKAVFAPFETDKEDAVNQYGFYHMLDMTDFPIDKQKDRIILKLAARNICRLYINGDIVFHGPARTAHGYCRVEEIDITDKLTDGVNHIAVEVMVYGGDASLYRHYSNDCTLEAGLFIAEIAVGDQVLSATGRDSWKVCKITARAPRSERISHCRECAEIYTLDAFSHRWKFGEGEYALVSLLTDEPIYLPHKALNPSMTEMGFNNLIEFGACRIDDSKTVKLRRFEENSPYYAALPEHPYEDCRRTVSAAGTVRPEYRAEGISFSPVNTQDYYAYFDGGENMLGFINLKITCEKPGIIDIVHAEILKMDGTPWDSYDTVTRLHVQAGETHFVTMEPALARYMLLYFRGVGAVTLQKLSVLDDSYPDKNASSFLCSDENVNRLYNAAKKTLRLNTKDIFMDCPEREKGGWLCDSLWTARAAALMLSDSLVEKEFLENFLLTPAEGMGHCFFPEVYPAHKGTYQVSAGITTWSFWLMLEVCEYIRRTGNLAFAEEHRSRINAFVNGSKAFLGASGLLENMPSVFVDWSLSNVYANSHPISTAANALYAYMLIELGTLYSEHEWVMLGRNIRLTLRKIIVGNDDVAGITRIPDAIDIKENGDLVCASCYSEAAIYTSLWSGLFTAEEAPALIRAVRDTMGPAPLYPKDTMIGSCQLFIGLCIRMDMLCRHGNIDKMYEELRAVYEPQLKEGPGTLWETQSLNNSSRCHGFAAHAGVHLMRDVLGLGIPEFNRDADRYEITIAPHICGLRWARGTHYMADGIVGVCWKYDGDSFTLNVSHPANVLCNIELPREVRMLDQDKVSVVIEQC